MPKVNPRLCTPLLFVTTTGPGVAPLGTLVPMLVFDQLETVAVCPLNVTVPALAPNPRPLIVTGVPTTPFAGVKPVIVGARVNVTPLLCRPPLLTTTFPVVAPLGTTVVMLESDQFEVVAVWPLNVTVPALPPKLLPEIVTDMPTAPRLGFRLLIVGASTVKLTPLLCNDPAVTTTLPLLAPLGTVTPMLMFDQLETVADWPLKVTVPVVEVKLFPVIVIEAPGSPLEVLSDEMRGATVNVTPLLAMPPAAVNTTLPVVAPVGTVALTSVLLQLVTVADVPLNVTPPLPWEGPRFDPLILTDEPTAPELGLRLMLGAGVTVNVTPLLATPPAAVTTTFPVVAPEGTTAVMLLPLQLEIVAVVPLNFTPPLPCDDPKLEPAMTIDDPTAPVLGVRLLMLGAGVTVNVTPLLAVPLTVTTTFPVVAPLGTVAVMLVELKLVMVAGVPLKVTLAFLMLVPKLLPAITMAEPTAPVLGVRLVMVGAAAHAGAANHSTSIIMKASRNFFISLLPFRSSRR